MTAMRWSNPYNAPSWFDRLSARTLAMYTQYFAPFVGYNPALWRVSEGRG